MKTNLEIPDSLIRESVNAGISKELKKLNIEAIVLNPNLNRLTKL